MNYLATHVLWAGPNGSAIVWNYSTADGTHTLQSYGPFGGDWTPAAIADGPDGLTRLLWTNANGIASLWSLDNTSGAYAHREVGPFNGWTAKALSPGQ